MGAKMAEVAGDTQTRCSPVLLLVENRDPGRWVRRMEIPGRDGEDPDLNCYVCLCVRVRVVKLRVRVRCSRSGTIVGSSVMFSGVTV